MRRAARENRHQSRELVNALNRASTVVLCSLAEGYFEEVFLEGWDALENAAIVVDNLPPKLGVELFLVESLKITQARHEANLESRVHKFFEDLSHLWESGQTFDTQRSRVEKISKRFGSPKPKNVLELFQPYGIDNVFRTIEEKTNGQLRADTLKMNLSDFVNRRNMIAHGNIGVTPTVADTRRYLDHMKVLCRHVDAVLGMRIEEMTGTFAWSGPRVSCLIPPSVEWPYWL